MPTAATHPRTDAQHINITAQATLDVAAAASTDSPGVEVSILAYSGGVMRLGGFRDDVVIDLAKIQLEQTVPLVLDHRTGSEALIGDGRPEVKDNQLVITGTLARDLPEVQRAISLAKAGVSMRASVGGVPTSSQFIGAGKNVAVNGRTFTGPIEVIGMKLAEVSLVAVPADDKAHATIAAQSQENRGSDMPETIESTESTTTTDPVIADRQRSKDITGMFHGIRSDEAKSECARLIESGASIVEAQSVAIRVLRASRPNINTIRGCSSSPEHNLEASAAKLLGASDQAIKAAGLTPLTGQGPDSLMDLAAMSIRQSGVEVPTSRDRIVRAAFSNDSFSQTLGTAISIVGLMGFESADEPALEMSHMLPLPDFKASTIARLNGQFVFEPLAPGGEIKHGVVKGEATPITLQTKAVMVQLDRQAIINDDRHLLSGIPNEMGREAARSVGDALADALDDTGGTFFTVARNNIMSGAASALSIASLGLAIVQMRTQKDNSGRVINFAPKFLLVGADLEATARAIVNSTEAGVFDGSPSGNPMRGVAEVLVDARIPAGQWFVVSGPQNAAIVLATLNGQVTPTVESFKPSPEVLGIGWRAWFDYSIALHEWRGIIKSLGT